MTVQCPHCKEGIDLAPVAFVPDEQKLTATLTLESDGVAAATVGKFLMSIDSTMRAVAKDLDEKVVVFLTAVRWADRELAFDFAIIKQKPKEASKEPPK